jgi:RND family efflux transporter MFP subunit
MRRSLLALMALALCVLTGCMQEEAQETAAPRPVLSLVTALETPPGSDFAGTIEPRYSTDLGFQVLGRMTSRSVEVGDTVSQGDLIAALDPAKYQFAVRAAEASLSAAEAQLTNARASEKRAMALVKSGVTAKAALESAEQTRKSAEASVRSARAELEKAREHLDHTKLIATFDGVVTATDIDIGDVVTAGETVLTLARLDVRDAVVDIPEDLVSGFRSRTFEIRLQAFDTPPVMARIREIAPRATSATRTQRIRMTLEDPPPTFRLGALITAKPAGVENKALNLPATALLEEGGKTFVWIVNSGTGSETDTGTGIGIGTVHRTEVAVERNTGSGFKVKSGLEAGVRIVTAGVHSLTDGQEVALRPEQRK